MEAHDALSARIAEEAGFKALWAGSLATSAALGVRDCNELSWTQVLDTIEFMSDAAGVPIVLDGDTGYGNFNNVRRLVRKLESRGIAAVCIEDKLFPKTNSLVPGACHPLADIDEFCGRIRAAKDVQADPDFTVIARVEAFIADLSIDAALERASAYRQAGADAVLIHSKSSDATEIVSFMRQWDDQCPVVIIPTTYYQTPLAVFQQLGISVIIWANHMIRASISSMQTVAREINRSQSVSGVEAQIAPVKEIFRLQRLSELRKAERKYLPRRQFTKAYVVNLPEWPCMRSLASSQCETSRPGNGPAPASTLHGAGIRDVVYVDNESSEDIAIDDTKSHTSNSWPPLWRLIGQLDGPSLIIPTGLIYETGILSLLRSVPGDIVIGVDASNHDCMRTAAVPVKCSEPFSIRVRNTALLVCCEKVHEKDGDWIGLMKVTCKGVQHLRRAMSACYQDPQVHARQLLETAIRQGASVKVWYVTPSSAGVDSPVC